jgi:hypothetical protein
MKEITVRISAAMIAQVLTDGHQVPPVKVVKGLPPGSRLIGAVFDEAQQAVLTFRSAGFPEGARETLSIEMKFMRGFGHAQHAATHLLAALKLQGQAYVDGQLCFCGMVIENPMVKDHAPHCLEARAAIAMAEPGA